MKKGITTKSKTRRNMYSAAAHSKKWTFPSFFFLLIFALSLNSCSKGESSPTDPVDQNRIEASMADFGEADMALAFDLLHEAVTHSEEGKNVLISPLSVHVALQMVLNGAGGDTYDAIANVLHSADYSETTLNDSYLSLVQALQDSDDKTALRLANSMFWDPSGVNPNDGFLEKLNNYFDAHTKDLDFRSEAALEEINDWVNEKTEGRIEKILEEIKPEEVMFLINALYFIGDWEKDFPEESTFDRNFTFSDGSKATVPMMHVDEYLNFFIGNDLQAVDLIFGDSSFSMTCIRPVNETGTIDDFIQGLDKSRIKELWSRDLQRSRLMLGLPKFEISQDLKLNDALKTLGMEIAFDPNRADLSRLGESFGNLYISRVKHKTYLTIDESGAEGAAVTAVGVGVTSAPPTLFFDSPFFFIIRDLQFNSILFTGKVENPAEG